MPLYSKLEDALRALAEGRMIIVADSEDRENEADFLVAAEKITAEHVHFMISQGRGQLCVPVGPQIARRLNLKPMVPRRSLHAPCFTIPVDHSLCRTGVSPTERAFTIRKMVDESSSPDDFSRPGHIFPLIARQGGVLERPGHTEATVDLMRLAELVPAGVLCEICSCDGEHMAQGDELFDIATSHHLPIITIDEVIRTVRDAAEAQVASSIAAPHVASRLVAAERNGNGTKANGTNGHGAGVGRIPNGAASGPHRRNGKHQPTPPSPLD
jgi:3,4-dihydroxy 2-butanone 4-phosphate synthase / GTP cyclohydrolase II